MAKVGVANLKWKTVDLFAFTGEVVNESSQDHIEVHTQTFDNGQAFGQRSQTSVTTTRWTTVYLRNAAGEEMDAVLKDAKVRFPVGQTATLVWGRDIGAQLGPKIALFNNSTGQLETIKKGNNDLAMLPKGILGKGAFIAIGIVAILMMISGIFSLTRGLMIPAIIQFGLGAGWIALLLYTGKLLSQAVAQLMAAHPRGFIA